MARVLKGCHSFTCASACLYLPSYGWYSFIDPGGMEGWVGQ